jgi:catechol 2,3-dioxygenase-like lactoylglutathione lyase family enzyme
MAIEPRVSIVTLAVSDLSRAARFYKDGLGWPLSSAGDEHIAFFKLSGLVLALYPRRALAEDATVPAEGEGFRGVTLAHNVREKVQVAEVLRRAEKAGAKIVKPARDVFWGGHSGYFADPDGHLWEVAWNPHFPFAADGSLRLPD